MPQPPPPLYIRSSRGDIACQRIDEGAIDVLIVHDMGRSVETIWAVHIGARIMALAAPGELLVSQTVRDLVTGSGLRFRDAGSHTLKGVPGQWPLYAAETLST